MRSGPALFLSVFMATAAFAAQPRITFVRTIPAAHDLGKTDEVALISAIGDTEAIELLVEDVVDEINKSGTLRMYDARSQRLAMLADAVKKVDVGAFLAVRAFTCTSDEKSGLGGTHDVDGKRVLRSEKWIESKCTARVEVLRADGVRSSFAIKGEGASSHVSNVSDEERDDALHHAARFAALDAAEKITPRRVRESVPLDDAAPAFEEGFSMIESGRLEEARAIWESEMRRQPRAAALHFNLAALCEALGDRKAAEQHYVAAGQLAPQEKRYAHEYRSFVRRTP